MIDKSDDNDQYNNDDDDDDDDDDDANAMRNCTAIHRCKKVLYIILGWYKALLMSFFCKCQCFFFEETNKLAVNDLQ